MLSPYDDLPIHQVAEPVRHVGTSDRNFYDRYYFNCHPSSDELMLITGFGVYPNLSVADAFAVVRHDEQHRVVRSSRELGADRGDTSVGPFRIEVLEGLKRLRVILEPNEWGLAFDLTWEGAIPATTEPRHFDRQFGRIVFDSMRFAQVGRWHGAIELDGTHHEVTPDRWWGSRDRSWGIRPVGEPEAAGISAHKAHPGFFWIYAPMQFDDHAILFIAQERSDGARILEEAVRVWEDPEREPELLGRPEHEVELIPGTRVPRRATLRMDGAPGGPLTVDVEVLLPVHFQIGTGYGFDADWRHGMYQPGVVTDGVVTQGIRHDLSTDEGRAALWGMTDSVARFETSDGAVGHGLFEFGCFGPYPRYGLVDFFDGAPG